MEDIIYNSNELNTLCTRIVKFDTEKGGELIRIEELNIQEGDFIVEQAITKRLFHYKIENNIITIAVQSSSDKYTGTIDDGVLKLKCDEEVYLLIRE